MHESEDELMGGLVKRRERKAKIAKGINKPLLGTTLRGSGALSFSVRRNALYYFGHPARGSSVLQTASLLFGQARSTRYTRGHTVLQ